MSNSPNLALPYLQAAQAQKHVTVNDALRRLDAVVQLSVADRTIASPPPAPGEGARYLVAAGADGAWAGHDLEVAAHLDGAWVFFAPRPGWIAFCEAEDTLLYFTGSAWEPLVAPGGVESRSRLGINGVPDDANRLVVQAEATLFAPDPGLDPATGDARIKVTKTAAGDVASHLFQTGYSGRAEFGLVGSDDFSLKVSADGASWTEALRVDGASGDVAFSGAVSAASFIGDGSALTGLAPRTFRDVFFDDTVHTVPGLQGYEGSANRTVLFSRTLGTAAPSARVLVTVDVTIDYTVTLDEDAANAFVAALRPTGLSSWVTSDETPLAAGTETAVAGQAAQFASAVATLRLSGIREAGASAPTVELAGWWRSAESGTSAASFTSRFASLVVTETEIDAAFDLADRVSDPALVRVV